MSEFDQVDSRKKQATDDDVNLEQYGGFDASDRASSASIGAKRRGDPDCLSPLIEPTSDHWTQQRNVRPPSYDKKIGLVLQGGGALGSYQAGVYEALASSEYLPDWVAGISIGAINAAIIVGNRPDRQRRRERSLTSFAARPSEPRPRATRPRAPLLWPHVITFWWVYCPTCRTTHDIDPHTATRR
jgi:hypothetical protein